MTLRVGIVGCGFISNEHVPAWRGAGAQIVAVCDKNASLAESHAKRWGIPKYYESIDHMMEHEGLDVVSICTPPQIRSAVITPFIQHGTHVVVEKPFSLSVAEASNIIEQQRRYGVKLTIIHCWLFSYAMNKALHILKENGIGEILGAQINVLATPDSIMTSDPHHWAHSLRGGRFAEMLPHPIYVLQKVLGELEVRHVLCSKLGDHDWMPIDELSVVLQNSKGSMASIYASFNAPRSEAVLKVYGTEAVMEVNLFKQTVTKGSRLGVERKQALVDNMKFQWSYLASSLSVAFAVLGGRYQGMFRALMREIVDCLEKDKPLPVTPEEALSVTRTYEDLCSRIDAYFKGVEKINHHPSDPLIK